MTHDEETVWVRAVGLAKLCPGDRVLHDGDVSTVKFVLASGREHAPVEVRLAHGKTMMGTEHQGIFRVIPAIWVGPGPRDGLLPMQRDSLGRWVMQTAEVERR